MSKYNFEELEIISKKLGNFIPIEEYEADIFIRHTQYPHVFQIKKDVFKYKNPDNTNNPIIRTLITKNLKASKSVLDRYLNWKPFGKGLNSESSQICEPVYIVPYNKLTDDAVNKPITSISKIAYKPKTDYNLTVKPKNLSDKPKLYKPSFINVDKVAENTFSLIIKNFSIDKSRDDTKESLYNLFSEYGSIKRLNIIVNKNTGQIKDIAFIDFYKQSDVNNILESKNRFILDNMVLTVEKNNKNLT